MYWWPWMSGCYKSRTPCQQQLCSLTTGEKQHSTSLPLTFSLSLPVFMNMYRHMVMLMNTSGGQLRSGLLRDWQLRHIVFVTVLHLLDESFIPTAVFLDGSSSYQIHNEVYKCVLTQLGELQTLQKAFFPNTERISLFWNSSVSSNVQLGHEVVWSVNRVRACWEIWDNWRKNKKKNNSSTLQGIDNLQVQFWKTDQFVCVSTSSTTSSLGSLFLSCPVYKSIRPVTIALHISLCYGRD